MPRQPDQDLSEEAASILSYFLRNPDVLDSLEGIAHWRLLEESIHRQLSQVADGLQWLVANRLLVQTSRPGAPPLFALNLERAAKARQLVERHRRPRRR